MPHQLVRQVRPRFGLGKGFSRPSAVRVRRGTIRQVIVLEVLLVAAVLFAVAAVAAGRGGALADPPRDAADTGLPVDRPLRAEDVETLRFGLALRGYRMAQVDEALDRLAAELADRDARLAELESGEGAAGAPAPAGSADPANVDQPARRRLAE